MHVNASHLLPHEPVWLTGLNPLEREGGYFPSTAKPCQAGDLEVPHVAARLWRLVFAPNVFACYDAPYCKSDHQPVK
ncbi:MAG TPA: hypothetical protein VJ842_10385 [Pyrinomonadaceae bacterium]|nr:hypothetical protein [Pyrinomonadaceae bacterium]